MITPLPHHLRDSPKMGSLESRAGLIETARQLLDGDHPGILTTVDATGKPHARWMATIGLEEFPYLHTLTAPDSAKVAHIARNPEVEWMFTSQDMGLVLNLRGRAEVVMDTPEIKRIWRSIREKKHAYFLESFAERPGFAVLRTEINQALCTVPQNNFRCQIGLDALKPFVISNPEISGRNL